MSNKVTFLVRETLTRERLYTITADTVEEAQDLLDGFKQQPVESAPPNEKIRVDDYTVLEIWK